MHKLFDRVDSIMSDFLFQQSRNVVEEKSSVTKRLTEIDLDMLVDCLSWK